MQKKNYDNSATPSDLNEGNLCMLNLDFGWTEVTRDLSAFSH